MTFGMGRGYQRNGEVLHKKGSKEDTANYRGISLNCTAYKIYTDILENRLKREVEKVRE